MSFDDAWLLAGRPISDRADRVVGIYVGVASVLYVLAYAADVAFAVDFWQGGGYSRLPFGDRDRDRDYRPLWLKIVVVLAFPVVFPLILNAMLALDVGIGDSWRLRLSRAQRVLLAVGSGPFLPVVAAGLTYVLDSRAPPQVVRPFLDPEADDGRALPFGRTPHRDARDAKLRGGIGTLACPPRRLRHCRIEADVGGVGSEVALRGKSLRDRFCFLLSGQQQVSVGAHLVLLLLGYRPGSLFAAFAPLLVTARVLVTLLCYWCSAPLTAIGGFFAASFFGVLLVASLLTEPSISPIGGSAPLFADGSISVSLLCAVWCWKLLILNLPDAALSVIAGSRTAADSVRRERGDCAARAFWVAFVLLILPTMTVARVVLQEFNQISWIFGKVLPLAMDDSPFTGLWARFLLQAPTGEDRARRLMHLLRCSMTARVYDCLGHSESPWRRSAAAFTDARIDAVLRHSVVDPGLREGVTVVPTTWLAACRQPDFHMLPLLQSMLAPETYEGPQQREEELSDISSRASSPSRLAWKDPLEFWAIRSQIPLLSSASSAPYPAPAVQLARRQAKLGPVLGALVHAKMYLSIGFLALRALCFVLFVGYVLGRAVSDPGDLHALHYMALALVLCGVTFGLVALPAALRFHDCASTRVERVDWDLGDLTLWISVYDSPSVGELLAGAIGTSQSMPFDAVQHAVAHFLSPSDIHVHAVPTATIRRFRRAAHDAGYCCAADVGAGPHPMPCALREPDRAAAPQEDRVRASAWFEFEECLDAARRRVGGLRIGRWGPRKSESAWNRMVAEEIAEAEARAPSGRPNPVVGEGEDPPRLGGASDERHPPAEPPTGRMRLTGGVGELRDCGPLASELHRRLDEALGPIDVSTIWHFQEWQLKAYTDLVRDSSTRDVRAATSTDVAVTGYPAE